MVDVLDLALDESPCHLPLQTLKEWVAVESDSVQPLPRLRQELLRMMALAAAELRRLGASVDSVDLGDQQVLRGSLLSTSCHSRGHWPGLPLGVGRLRLTPI